MIYSEFAWPLISYCSFRSKWNTGILVPNFNTGKTNDKLIYRESTKLPVPSPETVALDNDWILSSIKYTTPVSVSVSQTPELLDNYLVLVSGVCCLDGNSSVTELHSTSASTS